MNLSPRLSAFLLTAIMFVVAFDVAFLWQRVTKAHESELRGTSTEAMHYLSGLALRDYAVSGMGENVSEYLEKYRWSYSAIDIRASPIFHAIEGAWFSFFGFGRMKVMLLMSSIAAAFGALLFNSLKRHVGPAWAALGGVGFLCLPLTQRAYVNVSPDLLCAGMLLAAVLTQGRYFETGRWVWAAGFALFAGLSFGTGAHVVLVGSLMLLPPLLARDWNAFRRSGFWIACAAAAFLIAAWTYVLGSDHTRDLTSFSIRASDLTSSAAVFRTSTGPVLLIFAVYGVLVAIRSTATRWTPWSAFGSLVIGGTLAASVSKGTVAERHILIATVGVLAFATAAVAAFGSTPTDAVGSSGGKATARRVMAGLVFVIGIGALLIPLRKKEFSGFGAMASELVRTAKPGETIFVSSDDAGEGAFLAELAMRDPARPSFSTHRAGKMLRAGSSTDIALNRPYTREDQVTDFLHRTNVRHLVHDDALPEDERSQHYDLVRQTISHHGGNFLRQAKADSLREGELTVGGIVLFRVENLEH